MPVDEVSHQNLTVPRCRVTLKITLQETKMSSLHNEILLENIYDEVWCEYRDKHNLTDDQLYALEQNSQYGWLPVIGDEARKRFDEVCQ